MKYIFILIFFLSGNAFSQNIDLKQYDERYECTINKYLAQREVIDVPKAEQTLLKVNFKHYPNALLKEQLKSKAFYSLKKGYGADLTKDKTLLYSTHDGNFSSTVKVVSGISNYSQDKFTKYIFYDQVEDAVIQFDLSFNKFKEININFFIIKRNKSSLYYKEMNSIVNRLDEQIDLSKVYNDYSVIVIKLNELYEYSEKFFEKSFEASTPGWEGTCKKI